jgi:hypothetical protein
MEHWGENMWIFTTSGFVSAVRHRDKPEYLMVRARDSHSLEVLGALVGVNIEHTPEADYPYRLIVNQENFSGWIQQETALIDYDNFKSAVAIERGHDFTDVLLKVWSVMHAVEDEKARAGTSL